MDAWQERWMQWAIWDSPVLRLSARCAVRLLGAGLMAGAGVSGQPLFLPVGMIAACGGGIFGLAALVGTVLGSLAFWGPMGALEQVAAALLCFCVAFILRELPRSRWMPPVWAAVSAALLGGVAVWVDGFVLLLLLRTALAALCAAAFPRREAVMFVFGAVVLGAARVPLALGIRLGGLMAVCWTAAAALRRPSAAPAALAGGAAMDLATGGIYTLSLGLGCLAVQMVRSERQILRAAIFLLTTLCVATLFTEPTAALAGEVVLGTALALLMPEKLLYRTQQPLSDRQRLLHQAAEGLRALSRCTEQRTTDRVMSPASIFDRTAEQACRACSSFTQCWEQNSTETIAALEQIPKELLEHGHLRRDELPETFAALCRRPEVFTAALNHQLELRLCRRQGAVRLEELRNLQTVHSETVARLLDGLAASEPAQTTYRYRAVMGAAAAARSGEVVSGDAGSYCKGPDGRVYLLVCDGMGTGAEAARLSHAAVDALSALLQAGTAPEDALKLLGGAYLLRGDGAFSTVDLAAVDLRTGDAVIYKWGAAPSYLLTENGMKRVGTATIPPGVSADEALAAETVRLSLGRGETLVLVSDGAGGTDTERLLGAYDGCAPRELADRVVRAAQTRAAADDMTAAALRLERVQ